VTYLLRVTVLEQLRNVLDSRGLRSGVGIFSRTNFLREGCHYRDVNMRRSRMHNKVHWARLYGREGFGTQMS
jgi:hypothetical protein